MSEDVKSCVKHGKLNISQVIKAGKKNDIQTYKCSECYKTIRKNHYQKNKDKIYIKTREWKERNKARFNELNKNYKSRKKLQKEQEEEKEYIKQKMMNPVKRKLINLLSDLRRIERRAYKKHRSI